jgi:hypothetical protein
MRKMKPPRVEALKLLAYGPIPNMTLARRVQTKFWQLEARGLADRDGRGWRLTPEGRSALAAIRGGGE